MKMAHFPATEGETSRVRCHQRSALVRRVFRRPRGASDAKDLSRLSARCPAYVPQGWRKTGRDFSYGRLLAPPVPYPTQEFALLPRAAGALTSAAKPHVLHLAPIKEKLGAKWPRLFEPVHKLFEKAIRDAQGPHGHFKQLDELRMALYTFYQSHLAKLPEENERNFHATGDGAQTKV
jgi:hypothetical protein